MGKSKKRKNVSYEKGALESLQKHLAYFRRPLPNGNIPGITGTVEDLGKAVSMLPQREKEALERFWGLVPGTTNHGKAIFNGKKKDLAYENMLNNSNEALKKLLTIEYLYVYDNNVKSVIDNILTKVDRTGLEISDMEAIKYLLIFLIFIAGGHHMIFENDDYDIDLEADEKIHFDEYALLDTMWQESACLLEDSSIKLGLLIDIIQMFDVEDMAIMKSFVGLPLDKLESEVGIEKLSTFREVRRVKEKMFNLGAWSVTSEIIYGAAISKEQENKLVSHFDEFRKNWSIVLNFKTETKVIKTTQGEHSVDVYSIEGLEFTDLYELMSLYVCRKWL